MKHIYYYLCIIAFVMPCILYAPIKELSQLQQSLQKLTEFLGKSEIRTKIPITSLKTLTTYEELKKVTDEAYANQNPNLFDDYIETVAITTAKYLTEQILKENKTPKSNLPLNQPQYIPFVAYITEQITKQYDKNINLNCVCFFSQYESNKLLLSNELLLMRALLWIGYKNIHLIPMGIGRISFSDEKKLKLNFENWCKEYNVSIAQSSSQNGVALDLYKNTYEYIGDVINNKISKNHLFIMIKSLNDSISGSNQTELKAAINSSHNPSDFKFLNPANVLRFTNDEWLYLNIYIPYNIKDFFIKGYSINTTKKLADIIKDFLDKSNIKEITNKLFMDFLNDRFFDSLKVQAGEVIKDIDLFFLDLIKNTAIDPHNSLAFRSLKDDPELTSITDMSGTLQEIYYRYKRP